MSAPSGPLLDADAPVTDAALRAIAHMPTRSLDTLVHPAFLAGLTHAHRMRVAVWLARKSYDEGGCPIGAVVVHASDGRIVGKGHNTLVQENHPYNHGETSAMRDAGRVDFSETVLYTTLSPCEVCAALIANRGVGTVFVGHAPPVAAAESDTRAWLRDRGVTVEVRPDPVGVALYERYAGEKPAQNLEDWRGLAAVRRRG